MGRDDGADDPVSSTFRAVAFLHALEHGGVRRVLVYALHLLRILLEVEKLPLLRSREVHQLVRLRSHAIMGRDVVRVFPVVGVVEGDALQSCCRVLQDG